MRLNGSRLTRRSILVRLNISCWPTAVFYAPVVFCCGFSLNLGTLSSAVAYVEFAPSLGGVFFGRYFRDLFNDDLCPRVLRV